MLIKSLSVDVKLAAFGFLQPAEIDRLCLVHSDVDSFILHHRDRLPKYTLEIAILRAPGPDESANFDNEIFLQTIGTTHLVRIRRIAIDETRIAYSDRKLRELLDPGCIGAIQCIRFLAQPSTRLVELIARHTAKIPLMNVHFGQDCWSRDPRPVVDSVMSQLCPPSVEFEQKEEICRNDDPYRDYVQAFKGITSCRTTLTYFFYRFSTRLCERNVGDFIFSSSFPTNIIFHIDPALDEVNEEGEGRQNAIAISDYLANFTIRYISLFQQLSGDAEVSTMAKTLLFVYDTGDPTMALPDLLRVLGMEYGYQAGEDEWPELSIATAHFSRHYRSLASSGWRVWEVHNPNVRGYFLRVMQELQGFGSTRFALHFQVVWETAYATPDPHQEERQERAEETSGRRGGRAKRCEIS